MNVNLKDEKVIKIQISCQFIGCFVCEKRPHKIEEKESLSFFAFSYTYIHMYTYYKLGWLQIEVAGGG